MAAHLATRIATLSIFVLLTSCATDPPDRATTMQRLMVKCARDMPADYVAITTPKIYYVHLEGDNYRCDWSYSNRADTTQEQLIEHVKASEPDAGIVAINDQLMVQVPPKRTPHHDSGPSWAEILLNGVAQVSAAAAGRPMPPSTYVSPPLPGPVRSTASAGQHSSLRAPYTSPSCARLSVDHYEPVLGANMYNWENTCAYPIQVSWCWVSRGQSTCKPDSTSHTLAPGEREVAIGNGGKEREVPAYFVCDMSRSDQLCVAADQ